MDPRSPAREHPPPCQVAWGSQSPNQGPHGPLAPRRELSGPDQDQGQIWAAFRKPGLDQGPTAPGQGLSAPGQRLWGALLAAGARSALTASGWDSGPSARIWELWPGWAGHVQPGGLNPSQGH